ncbi:hypothetical protein ONE63_002064 [Megalurothrips usitatus]|uniref:Uncharacterized protein n=1 Tax=Megalurothrips usitatus TaxID=439358 RepID=A0AAV7XE23_9NEOP|nr:hypothetical protein ONE63_002064 [Megalurothrips usitatus]
MMAAAGGAGAAAMHGHGKFFQDFYSLQYGPRQIEFGHVCEDPDEWEQRFERKDLDKEHHQGQVRWGDKHGGYGEHYWDYNHGGHHGGDGDGGGEGSAPVPDFAEHQDEGPRPQYKRQSGYSDQSGAASGASGGSDGPGRGRAYRKKYVRPTTTAAAPTHAVPRARTTPRPPPHRQPPPTTPSGPLVAAAHAAAKTSKPAAAAAFFGSDFPAGGMFHQAAAAAGLGPRTARETAAAAKRLAFDPRTGRVHDEDTGQVFVLQPIA